MKRYHEEILPYGEAKGSGDFYVEFFEADDGSMCKYEEVAAELAAVTAERDRLREEINYVADAANENALNMLLSLPVSIHEDVSTEVAAESIHEMDSIGRIVEVRDSGDSSVGISPSRYLGLVPADGVFICTAAERNAQAERIRVLEAAVRYADNLIPWPEKLRAAVGELESSNDS